jgi:hypothetical protein
MTVDMLFPVALVGAIVVATVYGLYRWGPGRVHRSVQCPEKKVRAQVEMVVKEGSFGAVVNDDIASCSLLPGPVDCEKKCLQ